MTGSTDHQQTIQRLALELRQFGRKAGQSQQQNDGISTGIAPLDELLPDDGLYPGTLVECLSQHAGSGACTIASTLAAQAMQENGCCIVIDQDRSFFPPARDLDRLVVVHPANEADALWALEQSLRCGGVAVVVCRLDRLHDHTYRRLQLAVETGGGIGLLLRPGECQSQPSWADIRLLIEPLPFDSRGGQKPSSATNTFSTGRLLRIELIHCRGRAGGDALELEIDDETNDVRLVPPLAAATNSLRAAGA